MAVTALYTAYTEVGAIKCDYSRAGIGLNIKLMSFTLDLPTLWWCMYKKLRSARLDLSNQYGI